MGFTERQKKNFHANIVGKGMFTRRFVPIGGKKTDLGGFPVLFYLRFAKECVTIKEI